MRLFIAAMLPQDTCHHLLNMQQALVENMVSCRLTGPEHLHLTLRFIGEVGDEQLIKITDWFDAFACSGCCAGCPQTAWAAAPSP